MNTPSTIPHEFAQDDKLAEAYRMGWNHGHGLACHNVPRLGDKLHLDDLGRVTVDAGNIREVHASLCYAAEMNSRQFSPFEFTAHAFNRVEELAVEEDVEGGFAFSVVDGSGDVVESFDDCEKRPKPLLRLSRSLRSFGMHSIVASTTRSMPTSPATPTRTTALRTVRRKHDQEGL
jgi:hypothetical protein